MLLSLSGRKLRDGRQKGEIGVVDIDQFTETLWKGTVGFDCGLVYEGESEGGFGSADDSR